MLSEQNNKKLKILLVLQTPWGTHLGMSRVHYELKLAYEAAGHQVDYLDGHMLYPKGNSLWQQITGLSTQERILAYLKEHAHQYDVIDANQRCIPYPKEDYGFKGIVLFRSHGLPPIYTLAENQPYYKKMLFDQPQQGRKALKTKIGDVKRTLTQQEGEWALWDSIRYADIVHTLNQKEYDYLKDYGIAEDKLVFLPNGIDAKYLEEAYTAMQEHQKLKKITFLGSWTVRKGITHLPAIAKALPQDYILQLLGTGNQEESIRAFIAMPDQKKLEIKTHFDLSDEIPLLKDTQWAIFPSYIEGMPLSIIEQISLGIPVLAFDIPGVREVLSPIDDRLLIPVGDEETFIKRMNELLSLSPEEYKELSQRCRRRAEDFNYKGVAQQFLDLYAEKLSKTSKL